MSYIPLGYVGNRIIYFETAIVGGVFSVRSNAVTGGDEKVLVSGCAADPLELAPIVNGGVVTPCTQSGTFRYFWSDGTTPAVQLSTDGMYTTGSGINYVLVGLSKTMPGCAAASCTGHAYVFGFPSAGTNKGKVLAQAFDATAPTPFQTTGGVSYNFLGVRNGRIEIEGAYPGAPTTYGIQSFDLDGGNPNTIIAPAGNTYPHEINRSTGSSPDGDSFLLLSPNPFGTFMAVATNGAATVDLTDGNTISPDFGELIPNDLALVHFPLGFRAKNRFTGVTLGGQTLGNGNTTQSCSTPI
jgi:hypothetical protein